MIIKDGKPSEIASGMGLGIVGAPVILFLIPWMLRTVLNAFGMGW